MPGLEGRILNQYQLRKLVGRGGMADVYEGIDEQYGRVVAVKVFKRDEEDMLRRFIREARFMSALHNEHLVPIYDSGQCVVDGYPRFYIVMPFLIGGTLRARIRRSPLLFVEACHYLHGIADALDYIHHEGIIHRDIKSSNVLLDAEGHCYLADFGIARTITDASQLTSTSSILGTVDYIAPELFETNQKANDLSDLYALGVLLFEMVTGKLPFTGENQIAVVGMHVHMPPPLPSSIVHAIPAAIDQVIMKALDKKPERRYGSAAELADAFCHAVILRDTRNIQDQNFPKQPFPANSLDRVIPIGGARQIILPPVPVPPSVVRAAHTPVPAPISSGGPELMSPIAPQPLFVSDLSRETRRASATPVAPVFPTSSHSNRLRFWVVAILAFVTLFLITGVVSYALLTTKQSLNPDIVRNPTQPLTTAPAVQPATAAPTATPTPNLTATTQALAQATATARTQATATARAHATATAMVNAQATAGVIQTATAGTPAYQDALNNPKNPATQRAEWDGLDGSSGQCVFGYDGYHVNGSVNLVNFYGCHETSYSYQNATVSVDVTILSGHSGGLFFRLNTDSLGFYDGYLFEIDSKGHYKISTVGSDTVTTLQDWRATSALKQGLGVQNTLQVIFSGTTYLFYANGVYLTEITDSTYTAVGAIGFLATTTETNADVLYNHLKVFPHS